ncbi:MAG: alcohol dehydrogenase catalytic domain-containing protein, partial [Rhodobacteraceae bacterium]|nr:alcohol dehydrogenase catalytic domain-containing protein [Paracoccaceae bacterium]
MKALVYMGPEVLSFQDMPDPQPERGEVLIKVAGVGVCGSDMHAFLGHDERRPAPLI